MFGAWSAEYTDKRVDRRLKKMGYTIPPEKIFYSPLESWIAYSTLLIIALFHVLLIPPLVTFLWSYIDYLVYLPLYILVKYLIFAYSNNSFALTDKELIVINPNFPFLHNKVYELYDIDKIVISASIWRYWIYLFLEFGRQYVEIEVDNKKYRFYCAMLELDAYDENLTKNTLDDLYCALKTTRIPVNFIFFQ